MPVNEKVSTFPNRVLLLFCCCRCPVSQDKAVVKRELVQQQLDAVNHGHSRIKVWGTGRSRALRMKAICQRLTLTAIGATLAGAAAICAGVYTLLL